MHAKRILYYLGNVCIAVSLVGFIAIFYPIVQIYLFPPQVQSKAKVEKGFSVMIQKINAYAPIIANVDPLNAFEYLESLKRGVAHAKGTSLPGQQGTVYLFAHSSSAPWEITRYNTIFLRLNELEKNDQITIDFEGKRFTYKVTGKKEVWPNEINYLQSNQVNQLILQTCTPIGTALKRLLVFAALSE